MIRRNSKKHLDAISELQKVIQSYSKDGDKQKAMINIRNWNIKYRSPETYRITKNLWRKIFR